MYWYFSIRSNDLLTHLGATFSEMAAFRSSSASSGRPHVVASRAPAVERLDRRKEHNRYQIDLAYACGSKSSSTLTLLASFLMISLACAMAEGWSSRLLQQSAMFSLQDSQRTARVSSSAPEASSAALV